VAGAIWYQLSITDVLNTTKHYWYEPEHACPGPTCSMTPSFVLAIGPAQWQVRAWRSSGSGAWSIPVSFETADAAPGKATLIAPSSPVPSATPTFTWNAVLGTSYYLLRATGSDNIEIERWYRPSQVGCPLGTGTCAASPGGTIHPGPANWRVLTWNGSGYGPWSDPFTFTVEIPDPAAGIPQTIGPSGAITNPNATYRWTSVAGAVSYRLAISNNGQPEVYWWFSPAAAGCLTSAECAVAPQAGLQSGTATWRVQAWTVNGHSGWSAAVPLTVNIPPPTAAVVVSPSGSTTAAPQFVWSASPNATLYYIRAHDSTGLRIDRWVTPAAVGCSSGTGSCTMSAGVTLNAGAGSWEVLAWNASGYSPWSARLSFVVP
jgi:hypothetical protein